MGMGASVGRNGPLTTAPIACPMPVLYSFRRCPYAIRARLALAAAGFEPGQNLELREVSLRAKPPELLEASAKGTVPVLVVPRAQFWEQQRSRLWFQHRLRLRHQRQACAGAGGEPGDHAVGPGAPRPAGLVGGRSHS